MLFIHDIHIFLCIHSQHHSSEIRGLCLMKWPSKMLQNLPFFIYIQKPKVDFSFRATFFFPLMNALVYVDITLEEKLRTTKWKMKNLLKKYGKFWSILLGHFIKHKPLIFEGVTNKNSVRVFSNDNLFSFFFKKKT